MTRGNPPGENWFPVDVTIQDTQTGETYEYKTWDSLENGEWSDFIWSDGNYACDCNRAIFVGYAQGKGYETHPCGDGRYKILSIVDARTGRILYHEGALGIATPELSNVTL